MIDTDDKEMNELLEQANKKAQDAVMEALREQLSGGTLNIVSGRLIESLKIQETDEGFEIIEDAENDSGFNYGMYWQLVGGKPWETNADLDDKITEALNE